MQRGETLKFSTATRKWGGGGGRGLDRENWPWSRSTIIKNDHFSDGVAKGIVEGRKALQPLRACAMPRNAQDYTEFLQRTN